MATGTRNRRASSRSATPFDRKLVLNKWLLGLFGVERFEQLAEHLRSEELEGLDDDNIHRFYHALVLHLPADTRPELPDDLLLEYDQNIVGHTQRLNERRITRGEAPIVWKYFQYLALLFTEIYLDRYFSDPQALLASINEYIAAFNSDIDETDRVEPFATGGDAALQLNKLAFWMATGSGKTLLMHANILQYKFYLERHGRSRDLNRVILLTPNEGLSKQHLREFETAGIEAELFNKQGRSIFAGQAVEIIDIHKLKDEMGDKTVAVDAFEGNNLVLIDEGHRGASAGEKGAWLRFRNALCEKGFSFEYSATFSQAVKGSAELTNMYAKSILFDYSYRYFYGDGFGKDYQIANLEDDSDPEWMDVYLTACLLAFYQQLRLYQVKQAAFRPFNLEKPLWIFVGGSVNAVRTENKRQISDVLSILKFFERYLNNRRTSIERIRRVLVSGLVSASGKNLFAGHFAYLNTAGLEPERVFDETLKLIFNAPAGGLLHVENLKGAAGEIALRLGDNEPFGVINVGDDAKLLKLCTEHNLITAEREFSGSLFHEINQSHSPINILIGSKKFTEGWNSWRVSTMGLMNVGRGEGSQIIQLFGRGVRLKGYGMSLKRSSRAPLPSDVKQPWHIEALETLNIFGVRADYMAQFREYLAEEGLPTDEREEFILPVIRDIGGGRLKTIRLKKTIGGVSTEFGDAFRRLGPIPTLMPPDPKSDPETVWLQENKVVLNWYPKIQALRSLATRDDSASRAIEENVLNEQHISLLDIDKLYFDVERFKAERGWYNLNITREGLRALLNDRTWYKLLIPSSQLAFDSMDKVILWQEIASALLKKYVERYYTFRKRQWELPHLEYQSLAEDDPNFYVVNEQGPEYGYRIMINESDDELRAKLEELKAAIEAGVFKPWEFRGIKAIWLDNHLYKPLLSLENGVVEITPVPLNKGERRFIEDLKSFVESESAKGESGFFAGKELYVLRNLSKGRGVGFFEAGNFHPDFILWLLVGEEQHVIFVDPKGIRNLSKEDPKIRFHKTVKQIEERLGDPSMVLHSFIISNTSSYEVERLWGMDKDEIQALGIVFQEDEGYIEAIFTQVLDEL